MTEPQWTVPGGTYDVVFTTPTAMWFVTHDRSPYLAELGDRDRAVLRALLNVALSRLDTAETRIDAGLKSGFAPGGVVR